MLYWHSTSALFVPSVLFNYSKETPWKRTGKPFLKPNASPHEPSMCRAAAATSTSAPIGAGNTILASAQIQARRFSAPKRSPIRLSICHLRLIHDNVSHAAWRRIKSWKFPKKSRTTMPSASEPTQAAAAVISPSATTIPCQTTAPSFPSVSTAFSPESPNRAAIIRMPNRLRISRPWKSASTPSRPSLGVLRNR